MSRREEKELFDARTSFIKLPIVQITAVVILAFAAIEFFLIYSNGNYIKCHSASCYNSFLEDFKFPLGITALLIPFGAIYAAQHRSEISIVTIEKTTSQNNFANYYKHLEEFKAMLKEHQYTDKFSNYRKLHLILFPQVKEGDYKIPNNIRNMIVNKLLLTYHSLRKIEKLSKTLVNSKDLEEEKRDKILKYLVQAYTPIKELRQIFQFIENDQDTITSHGLSELKNKINFYNYISEIQLTALYLKEITIFCGEFEIPEIMIAISKLETNGGIIHGIPTSYDIEFNLPEITKNGELIST